jgi:calcium-dependent protein kinase
VHGDIKPSNIHFHTVEDEIVKMIDFGSSRRVAQDELLHGVYGTSYYVAPETLEGGYDHSADVWAVGVLLYILLSGEPPFDGESGREITTAVKNGQYKLKGGAWDAISNEAKDLISNMLCPADKRISAAQAFQHPWFERAMKP